MSTVTINGQAATREEWLAIRRGSIGASECAVVLGLTPSKVRLYLDKKGLLEPEPPTPEMKRGLLLEPYIAGMWSEQTGDPILETQRFFRHPAMEWLSATVDGITASGKLVEFKRVGPHGLVRRVEGPDDLECLPDPWMVQCHAQMLVTGHETVWFAIKTPDDDVHCVGPVRRNENLCSIIARECREFWHSNILADVPPDEVHHEDARALARAFRGQSGEMLQWGDDRVSDVILYHEVSRHIREQEKTRDECKARLLLALGDAAGAELPGGWGLKRSVIEVNNKARDAFVSTQVRLTVQQPKD